MVDESGVGWPYLIGLSHGFGVALFLSFERRLQCLQLASQLAYLLLGAR